MKQIFSFAVLYSLIFITRSGGWHRDAFLLSCFCSLLLLVACKDSGYKTREGIEVDLTALDHNVESTIGLDSLTYIPLETTDESLLESISKVIFKNNKFYVLDSHQGNQGLFVFSETGEFLRKVSGPGAGPGEYNKVMIKTDDQK